MRPGESTPNGSADLELGTYEGLNACANSKNWTRCS